MQLLDKCEGVRSLFDDIVIHGSDQDKLDQRLHKVLSILQDSGLTLNYDKCKFNLPEVEFMGHILSERGVGLSNEKSEGCKTSPTTRERVRGIFRDSLTSVGGSSQTWPHY